MGAWSFVDRRIEQVLAGLDMQGEAAALCRPRRRRRRPRPAWLKRHVKEQAKLVDDALTLK